MEAAGEGWQTALGWLIILLLWWGLAAASGRSRRPPPRDRKGPQVPLPSRRPNDEKPVSVQAPLELADRAADAAPEPPAPPAPGSAAAAPPFGGRAGQLWSMAAAGIVLSEVLGPPRCRRPYRPPRAGGYRS